MQKNPFREGMPEGRAAEPCTMVIFGATGDLTRRKLVPALYNIARDRLLPQGFAVMGLARRDWSDQEFRDKMREAVDEHSRSRPVSSEIWREFEQGMSYVTGEFGDKGAYEKVAKRLKQEASERGTRGNCIFYLATPPSQYAEIISRLGEAGLAGSAVTPWSRIIIEKPFGRDLESARELNRCVLEDFSEDQIYRIDHYLGKETVQNILVMRFANGIFEPLWNQKYVDHVQITVAENLGMEGRGSYYDAAGTLRDMVQNHMMQLLCLTAMEPPGAFEAEAVRNEKVKVLKALHPLRADSLGRDVVRAQYTAGSVSGEKVPGYLSEEGVAEDSTTETYVAIKTFIDNWRWAGVPFYLRSGKRLPKRATEIAIVFKQVPHSLFTARRADGVKPNVLAMRIQPDEGISVKMISKVPGMMTSIQPVLMDFRYGTSFGADPPEAYERLLLDCMSGDSTLFTRGDEVDEQWKFVDPMLEYWASDAPPPEQYEAGTWGPKVADKMIGKWRRL